MGESKSRQAHCHSILSGGDEGVAAGETELFAGSFDDAEESTPAVPAAADDEDELLAETALAADGIAAVLLLLLVELVLLVLLVVLILLVLAEVMTGSFPPINSSCHSYARDQSYSISGGPPSLAVKDRVEEGGVHEETPLPPPPLDEEALLLADAVVVVVAVVDNDDEDVSAFFSAPSVLVRPPPPPPPAAASDATDGVEITADEVTTDEPLAVPIAAVER